MATDTTTNINDIDLFGWDTAFAISYSKANEAIKALKSSPPSFKQINTSKSGETEGTIQGNWGDWELTTNGDGQNITLKCPITSGTFSSLFDSGTNYPLDNCWVEYEIKLTYLDQPHITYSDPTAQPGTGSQTNLVARTQSTDPTDPVASVMASSYSFPDSNDPDAAKAMCDSMFKSWASSNLSQFQHVFAIFNVNAKASQGAFQWLKPTSVSYAVSSTDSLDTSVFGVLAMTQGRPVTLNAHTIDPRLLTVAQAQVPGTPSAFAISATNFVQQWILPGMLTMRIGSTAGDYVLANDGLSYQNVSKIQWGTFTDQDNNAVPATIEAGDLKVGLVGDLLEVNFINLYWDTKPGITAHVNYTEFYKLGLASGTDAKGVAYKNVLTATEVGTPNLVVSTSIANWKRYEDLGISIGISIVGALVGGLAGGAFDAASAGVADAVGSATTDATTDTVSEDLSETLANLYSKVPESEESIAQLSTDGLTNASDDIEEGWEMIEQGESSETVLSKFVGKVQDFGKSMWAAKFKLIGGMVGGAVGAGIGSIPSILDAINQKNFSDVPSLDEFGANCVGSVQWPNSSGFTLNSATLAGALILGGDLED